MKKRAFTLIELMVVLAIIALLSALIFGAISSVREGNKRGSCQGNLNLIYAATRLYAQDNDGQFPYLTPPKPNSVPAGSVGLWALYVYQAPSGGLPLSPNDPNNPAVLASYLKSPRVFHCPSDTKDADGQVETPTHNLNPAYLSYQGLDSDPILGAAQPTYATFRGLGVARQIGSWANPKDTSRRAPDQTVMLWCRFHRPLDKNGDPATTDGSRTFDNVLFLDGSVQSVPVKQIVTGLSASGATTRTYVCQAWGRVPLAEANATSDTVLQEFVTAGVCQAQ